MLQELELEIGRGLGGEGRLVLIEGEAGIGKTRLLDAVVATPREARVLHATAGQYERDLAFGVARRLLGAGAFEAAGPVPLDLDVGAVLEGLHLRVLALAEERRCCSSSTTCTGPTPPRSACSPTWRGGSRARRWPCSPACGPGPGT